MSGLDAAILNKLNKLQDSIQIDEAVALKYVGKKVTLPSGAVLLKTGTIETDIESYPDASVQKLYQYDGILFDIHNLYTDVYDIDIYDADNYLTLDYTHDSIRRWSATGTSLAYYPLADTNQRYVVTDGAYVYSIGLGGTVYQYPWDGDSGTLFTTLEDGGRACWDGTHFWMERYGNTLEQYTSLWVATGVTITLDTSAAAGFTLKDGYWYTTSCILNYDGTDTGGRLSLSSSGNGVGYNGSQICTCGESNGNMYAYSESTEYVGDKAAYKHDDTGYPYYVRIK